MPSAADGLDVARIMIRAYEGWALELAAFSLAVFLLRYAVVLYASHLLASLSGLHAAAVGDCRAPGLDGTDIARLPCFVAARGGGDDATADCAVCLGAVEEGETVRALPGCRHAFHARCVDAWLRLRATCPVCRATCR